MAANQAEGTHSMVSTRLRPAHGGHFLAGLALLAACAGCQSLPVLRVPMSQGPFRIDGRLDEPCYATTKPLDAFVVAGLPDKKPAATKAWVFWQPDQLVFAFECEDATILAKEPTSDESDVDGQDRVELFLWNGRPQDTYFCIEIAARGAVHDYSARFYRRFDSSWQVPGLQYAVAPAAKGYCVEAAVSRSAMEACGFDLKPGENLNAGLFRADFHASQPGVEPDWITWVDARSPKPDFHVAGSFGCFRLMAPGRK